MLKPQFFSELSGLAAHLVRDGLVDVITARAAVADRISVTNFLVRQHILSSEVLLQYCAAHFNLAIVELKNFSVNSLLHSIVKPEIIARYRVIPLSMCDNTLQLGITDPTDHAMLSAIAFQTGMKILPVLVDETELDRIILTLASSPLEVELTNLVTIEETTSAHSYEQNDEPVINFVHTLIQDAIKKNISDIHIETYDQFCRVRFRRDGLLFETAVLPPHLAMRIILRLKVMADLNIAERRLPQDGRIKGITAQKSKEKIDVRLNSCPTLCGEKIVLRILKTNDLNLDLQLLGLLPQQLNCLLDKLDQPQGLILVTGPTGSGKSITLYSALNYLNRIEKNISSVEDPVEIELSGINQVSIHPKIGLDFATVLRSFLRQDPDIIMVGEIRDQETATIAMQAAQTGHLVLSTLHTNSALETISRLQSMGIASYHLISSLSLIITQRLVRILCSHCKLPVENLDSTHDILPSIFTASSCKHCHQGYRGRTGIFEVIPVTEHIAMHLHSGGTVQAILNSIKQQKWMLLWDAGLEKIRHGVTSFAELTRVLGKEGNLQ